MFKDYTMNQVILPLDLEYKLDENDIAYVINNLIEEMPDQAFDGFKRDTGCPSYHPRMMMKIILCSYTQSVFSGRKIESLLKDSVRMMWLSQGYEPSYRTINRFRVHPEVKELLRQCFVQFRCQLVEEKQIDEEAIFIDGTKIEANANKFTFVWRKSIENYSNNLIKKSNEMYDELLEKEIIPEIERESSEELSVKELEIILKNIDDKVEQYNHAIEISDEVSERKELRSIRKEPKQYQKKVQDFLTRKQKYQEDMIIFKDRNSYSKTDQDATFMRMKDDYMGNGQLKPAYNVQVATEGQYALAYEVFPNPGDTRTLIPFLTQIENNFFSLPQYIVADAGYGSEQNYDYILNQSKRIPLITYNQYRKEQKKKFKNDPFKVDNWEYNKEEDIFVCPNGKTMYFSHTSTRADKYGFLRTYKVYESEDCSDCPLRSNCTKAKPGVNRKIYYNETWEEQKAYTREVLSNESTEKIYKKRKIDVEPVFGFLKANLRFIRLSVRSKEKVENELGFAFMTVNLRKYTAINNTYPLTKKQNQQKTDFNYQSSIIEISFLIFS